MKNSRGSNCWLPWLNRCASSFSPSPEDQPWRLWEQTSPETNWSAEPRTNHKLGAMPGQLQGTLLVTTNGMIIIQVGLKEDISTMSIIIYHIMIILYIMDYNYINYNCWNQQIPAIRFLSCQRWSQRGWARRITHKVWPWSKRLCRSNWKIQIDLNARHTALVQTKNPWSKIEDEVVRQSTKS